MKAMICKQEKGFEPEFFDVNTLDNLLEVLFKYGDPPIQITIIDEKDGELVAPLMEIEILPETNEHRRARFDRLSAASRRLIQRCFRQKVKPVPGSSSD